MLTRDAAEQEPGPTQIGFDRLLAWLDGGVESHGERYLEMRRRLVAYFNRRSRQGAEELADETLNRIARTLGQPGAIATRPPARYCYAVAKYVLLEHRRRERRHVPLNEPRLAEAWRARNPGPTGREERLEHLERLECCLQMLKPAQRDLIVEYYGDTRRQKAERRRSLAMRLGITMNALTIRAYRIRESLMACVCGS